MNNVVKHANALHLEGVHNCGCVAPIYSKIVIFIMSCFIFVCFVFLLPESSPKSIILKLGEIFTARSNTDIDLEEAKEKIPCSNFFNINKQA